MDYDDKRKIKDIIACNQYKNKCDYKIHDIEFKDKEVIIKLGRPGLFIGRNGNNINNINEEIKSVADIGIRIEEFNPLPISSIELIEVHGGRVIYEDSQ